MTDYNTDFALWAREQAARLRAGAADLDRENIAEELDALARALHGELDERLARLIQSLLQWTLLEGDWRPADTLARAWRRAQDDACVATGLACTLQPATCPFTSEQILDAAFWPGKP